MHEFLYHMCYDNRGDNMKEEILIGDVVKSVDELLLNLEVYYIIKNINRVN